MPRLPLLPLPRLLRTPRFPPPAPRRCPRCVAPFPGPRPRALHAAPPARHPTGGRPPTFLHDDLTSTEELEVATDFVSGEHPVKVGSADQLFPPHLRANSRMGPRAELRPISSDAFSGEYGLVWVERPRTVLVLKKPNDVGTERAFLEIMRWMYREYPDITLAIEDSVASGLRSELLPNVVTIPLDAVSGNIDFVITLGGDGTILYACQLFRKSVPPILSFSMGTLGFLLPFHIQSYRFAIRNLLEGDVSILLRMRISCSLHTESGDRIVRPDGTPRSDIQCMNEIVLHRGRQPHLTALDCFVNDEFLTDVVADGLIVSTPTGSTAYNLSAGGPILHPAVESMLFTPICPRSLSFRPAILPSSVTLKVRLSAYARGLAELSIDGRDWYILRQGEYCRMRQSPYFAPCVNRLSKGVAWVRDIREMLKWNINFENSLSLRHSEAAWDRERELRTAPRDPMSGDLGGGGGPFSEFIDEREAREARDEEEAAYRIGTEEEDLAEHIADSRRAFEEAAEKLRIRTSREAPPDGRGR
ncbi:ATP-NAD kinase-like domain-containing protein [Hyaloraphidium curvatum]|nr:ATP-NAD kinase-like domain-containing protein [Hyaloraphidium curvatum]